MKRIRSAYAMRFRQLLAPLNPRNMEKALDWFSIRAHSISQTEQILLPVAFHHVHRDTQRRISAYIRRKGHVTQNPQPIFWCDAGLGGLARWLRAAGYAAYWEYGIDDAELLRRAAKSNAIVLTTDSGMMERGLLRDGHLQSLWLPPALHLRDQLAAVCAEFHLERRPSRCTRCGGRLVLTPKEPIKHEIPPKTYIWLNEFWRCETCGKLFWNGTHWKKIQAELDALPRHA